MPPTVWLMDVATAAPTSPQPKTAMNSASRMMLVTPEATVTVRPREGFSAVTNRH